MRAVRLTLAAFALLVFGLVSSASAAPASATTGVSIQNFAFGPATVTVAVGDSVKWTNLDGASHSAVSQGSFNTGTLAMNKSGTITFSAAGTFAYVCGIHGASMSGTVIVRVAEMPAPSTPIPTPVPTPVPTVRPTPRPSIAATAQPSIAPTPEPALSPTVAPTQTATTLPAATAAVAVASATVAPTSDTTRTTTVTAQDGPPIPLIVGGVAAIVIGLSALAGVLRRR